MMDVMNEKIYDVIKWVLIALILGIMFYIFYPKYYFDHTNDLVIIRGNRITGKVEVGSTVLKWQEIGTSTKRVEE